MSMANTWDEAYGEYNKRMREGDVDADFMREVYGPLGGTDPLGRDFKKGDTFADRVIAIHRELEDQKKKFQVPVSGGDIGSSDAVWDAAFRIAETGTSSLYDLGQRKQEVVGYEGEGGGTYTSHIDELYHKPTGAAVKLPAMWGFGNEYQLQFTNDGTPVAYSTPKRSDWMEFREDFLRPAVNFAAPFIPGAGPWIAAANAAYAASKGDWEKALLSGLSAAVPLAGKFGAGAETVGTLNNVRQAANVLKALESKDLLGAALSGAGLAGVTEVGGYSMKDINQAVGMVKALQSEDPLAIVRAGAGYLPKGTGIDGPNPADFEKDSFDYDQIFNPNTAGSVDLSEKPYDPNYEPTTDFSVGADYSLAPKEDGLGFKVTAPPEVFNPDGSVNYDLFDYDALPKLGMDMPKSPNIDGMGGGQGLRLPVEGGYITEQGFIPEGYTPDLGDPNSFINKPAPGGDVSIRGALDAGAKATLADMNKQKPATPPKSGTPGSGIDVNQLMSLLGGQQAAPTIVSSGQDNAADVQLMEDIFGTTMSAPPAGDTATRARELARLLRS
jgi:hypothetical protein